MAGPSYLQYNTLQQAVTSGLELGVNLSDMTLKRAISTPISHPEALVDSSWDAELQNLYNAEFQQGSSTAYQSQPLKLLFGVGIEALVGVGVGIERAVERITSLLIQTTHHSINS
ncbi:hypothetical protein POM88_015636 [Heracleum sosnowskyi]|uniref:Uncharacterized protein n=1 Tax=Heracleum sosnowskyi TaxID=360622 RepID=A0AAD8ILT0_9APIA|nr:hypothetical protein POM88_015636 [Heracleum sosnowskyi]